VLSSLRQKSSTDEEYLEVLDRPVGGKREYGRGASAGGESRTSLRSEAFRSLRREEKKIDRLAKRGAPDPPKRAGRGKFGFLRERLFFPCMTRKKSRREEAKD